MVRSAATSRIAGIGAIGGSGLRGGLVLGEGGGFGGEKLLGLLLVLDGPFLVLLVEGFLVGLGFVGIKIKLRKNGRMELVYIKGLDGKIGGEDDFAAEGAAIDSVGHERFALFGKKDGESDGVADDDGSNGIRLRNRGGLVGGIGFGGIRCFGRGGDGIGRLGVKDGAEGEEQDDGGKQRLHNSADATAGRRVNQNLLIVKLNSADSSN